MSSSPQELQLKELIIKLSKIHGIKYVHNIIGEAFETFADDSLNENITPETFKNMGYYSLDRYYDYLDRKSCGVLIEDSGYCGNTLYNGKGKHCETCFGKRPAFTLFLSKINVIQNQSTIRALNDKNDKELELYFETTEVKECKDVCLDHILNGTGKHCPKCYIQLSFNTFLEHIQKSKK